MIAAWCCLCLLAPVVAFGADKKPGEKWAVLIGVDDYLNAGDLKYCGADQRGLRDELVRSGFDERQVFLLADEAKDKKLLPFRANIVRQLETVLGFAEQGDMVLIGFSGHGVHLEKTSYLCPTDAKLDDPATLISLDWIYEKLQKSKADLRVVMIDACRNDPRPRGQRSLSGEEVRVGTRAFVQDSVRLPDGVILIHSCSEAEVSQEDEKLGHGVFMHFVLEGLRGKADRDRDQQVTLDELVKFASKETKLYVEQKYNDSQRPKVRGNYTPDAMDVAMRLLNRPATVSIPEKPTSSPSTPSTTPPSAPGAKVITSSSTGMKLTLIPAGTFQMGSSQADVRAALQADSNFKEEYAKDEQPQHTVRISQPFYMGVHEVTQGEYEKVMATNPSKFSPTGTYSSDVSGQDTSKLPVENVSWYDAIEFCNKLSAKDGLTPCYSLTNATRDSGSIKSATVAPTVGRGYRLPTEAEWEYACRAGSTTLWHTGNTLASLNEVGWWGAYSTPAGNSEKRTNRVGQKSANSFGLFDMHGNVWEWCFDVYGESAYGNRSGTTSDPTVTSGSESRVLRGGSWGGNAWSTRTADRGRYSPDYRDYYYGFRVVCVGVRTP